MRKLLLFFTAVLLLSGLVAAHAGHFNSTDGEEPAGMEMPSFSTVFIFSSVGLAVLGLAVGFLRPEIFEDQRKLLLLIAVVALVALGGLIPEGEAEESLEAFGPGMSPFHMDGFYEDLDEGSLVAVDDIRRPPEAVPDRIERNSSRTVNVTLVAREVKAHLTENSSYYYWTYNSTVPGPTLRVREGDTVRLTLVNHAGSTHNHSIDLHAVTGPGGGAGVMGDVPPGQEKSIEFKASKEGFYSYHCATPTVATHVSNGMYGGIIVEPEEGMSEADEEYTVAQGEIYTKNSIGSEGFQAFSPEKMMNEDPTYYTMNGRPGGLTGEHRLEASVNDSVRIFYLNMGNSKTSSFHVIGEIFDRVYPGTLERPSERNIGTYSVANAQGSVFEFRTEMPGSYTLVDHALARTERGAWGIMEVNGTRQGEKLVEKVGNY